MLQVCTAGKGGDVSSTGTTISDMLYASDSNKIDWSDPAAPVNARSIPLVLFLEEEESPCDSLNFEQEVLGVALDQDIEGAGSWVPCRVVGAKKHSYDVVVAGMTNSQMLFRHRVLLHGYYDEAAQKYVEYKRERPPEYAARLGKALQARIAAESHIRFNLCVENMPVDDLPPLTESQQARIRHWAVNSKKLAKFSQGGMITELDEEVGREHRRALNKIMLTSSLEDHEQQKAFKHLQLNLHTFPSKKRAPDIGTVPVAPYNYSAAAKAFRDRSFNLHTEIILAQGSVHGECNRVVDLRLFATDLKKPLTLAEFQTQQQDAYKYASQSLKRNWTESLRMGVTTAFGAHTGSGSWKDLTISDRATLDKSPMRPLLKQMQVVVVEVEEEAEEGWRMRRVERATCHLAYAGRHFLRWLAFSTVRAYFVYDCFLYDCMIGCAPCLCAQDWALC